VADARAWEEERREWTRRIAAPRAEERSTPESAFLFRVGGEWLALPTATCERVVDACVVHTLPHRRGEVLLGIGSIRGDLILTVSLAALLGIPREPAPAKGRTLVLDAAGARFAAPVDEVHGIHRYHPDERAPLPGTLAAEQSFTTHLLPWGGRMVGLLDAARLFEALERSVR